MTERRTNDVRIALIEKDMQNFNEKISEIIQGLDKAQKIFWQDGLVNSVKTNTEYIQRSMSFKNRMVNWAYMGLVAASVAWFVAK